MADLSKLTGTKGDWFKDAKLVQMFQTRINHEEQNSRVYLAMYHWAVMTGWTGTAKFLKSQSEGETKHSLAFATYLSDLDIQPVVDALPKPERQSFASLKELFLLVMDTEKQTSKEINEMYFHAHSVQDAMALQILGEYMVEQREELDLVRTVLDFLEISGEDRAALLTVDEKIGDLVG